MNPWTDFEGTLIELGDTVAFNYSGWVARGIVEYVPDRAGTGAVKIAHINKDGRVKGPDRWCSGVSRVRNPRSILVLERQT